MAKVCGAKTRNGPPCQRPPLANRERCRQHGGATPRGVASPQFVTGRHSRDLPARLAARYEQALADEELLALRDDVALIDARLSDVLSRVDTGESGKAWLELRKLWQIAQSPTEEYSKRADARDRIAELIEEGVSDYEAWTDVRSLVDQRARLVSNERRRLVQLQQTITVEQALAMLAAVVSTIKLHVTDEHTLAALSRDIGGLVSVRPVLAARSERAGDAGRRSPR